MVSCCPVFHEFVTGTNTPDAAPLCPHVALDVVKVMESAKVTVMVMSCVAVALRPASVLPVTVNGRFVPTVRPLMVAVCVLITPSV